MTMTTETQGVPQSSPAAGWGDLVDASPAAAAVIVVVLFLRYLRDQSKEQQAGEAKREEARLKHEQRLADQYERVAEGQTSCIRENTQVLREFVQKT